MPDTKIRLFSAWWVDADDSEHEETILTTTAEAGKIEASLRAKHRDATVSEWDPENRAALSAEAFRARYRIG